MNYLTIKGNITGAEYGVHVRSWSACQQCSIGISAFRHVFARGELPCEILIVGEGPGENENVMGYPFVGRAGKLLDEWLAPFSGRKIAITNVVCCRPTTSEKKNRQPTPQEISNCSPRLREFVDLARPRAVILLGKVAAEADIYLPEKCDRKLALYHPAYILRKGIGGKEDLEVRRKLREFLCSQKGS